MSQHSEQWADDILRELEYEFAANDVKPYNPWPTFVRLIRAANEGDAFGGSDSEYLDRIFKQADPLWIMRRLLIGDGWTAFNEENWIGHNDRYAYYLQLMLDGWDGPSDFWGNSLVRHTSDK